MKNILNINCGSLLRKLLASLLSSEILKRVIVRNLMWSAFVMLASNSTVFAWEIFGPTNYEECIVEKMKGQDKSMIWRVEEACEIKFPFERSIDLSKVETFKWNWETRSNGKVVLKIIQNETVWSITRVKLFLFEEECNAALINGSRSVTAEFVTTVSGSEFINQLSTPRTYRCGLASFWGKRRR